VHVPFGRSTEFAANEAELIDVVISGEKRLPLKQLGKDAANGL